MHKIMKRAIAVSHNTMGKFDVKDVAEFWTRFGRPDLIELEECEFISAPFLEALHYVQRKIRQRDEPKQKRPRPQREYITFAQRTYDVMHHYVLHTTKGWRRSRLSRDEGLRWMNKYGIAFHP